MFVPAVAANEFAKNTIVCYVGMYLHNSSAIIVFKKAFSLLALSGSNIRASPGGLYSSG